MFRPQPADSGRSFAAYSLRDSTEDPLNLTLTLNLTQASMTKLIDTIAKTIDKEPRSISIDDCLTELQELRKIIDAIEDKSLHFNINEPECKQYLVAVNLVLLYTSAYPVVAVNPRIPCSVLNERTEMVNTKPVFPDFLTPVDTRSTDRRVHIQDFYKACQARENAILNPISSFEKPLVASYMVNPTSILKSIDELCEMFTAFKDIEKISTLVQRLKNMTRMAAETTHKKHATLGKIKEIKENLTSWEAQADKLFKSMKGLNEATAGDDNTTENIKNVDAAFNANVTAIINQLPIARLHDELSLCNNILSLCTTLSKPFSAPAAATSLVECPVCLIGHTHNLVAIKKCGHVLCSTCVVNLDACPICRADIGGDTLKLYFREIDNPAPQ
jgi:hypothetical protein